MKILFFLLLTAQMSSAALIAHSYEECVGKYVRPGIPNSYTGYMTYATCEDVDLDGVWQPIDVWTWAGGDGPNPPETGDISNCSFDYRECQERFVYDDNPHGYIGCYTYANMYCGTTDLNLIPVAPALGIETRNASVYGSLGVWFLGGLMCLGIPLLRIKP